MFQILWLVLALALLGSARAYAVVSRPQAIRKRSEGDTCSLAVFMGSGGHTSEALLLLGTLDFGRYTPRTYIVSAGDALSAEKAIALEKSRQSKEGTYRIITLPRARRVHQSLLTTPPTFIKSLLYAVHLLAIKPALTPPRQAFADVLVLNGPGTCVPVCLAAYLSRALGLPSPRIIYIESFARVSTLSLSAKLLRQLVDSFVAQWPNALKDGRGGKCRGWLV